MRIFSSTFILVVIGAARTLALTRLQYPQPVSEYGVHWNFFYTFAVVQVTIKLISCCYEFDAINFTFCELAPINYFVWGCCKIIAEICSDCFCHRIWNLSSVRAVTGIWGSVFVDEMSFVFALILLFCVRSTHVLRVLRLNFLALRIGIWSYLKRRLSFLQLSTF